MNSNYPLWYLAKRKLLVGNSLNVHLIRRLIPRDAREKDVPVLVVLRVDRRSFRSAEEAPLANLREDSIESENKYIPSFLQELSLLNVFALVIAGASYS